MNSIVLWIIFTIIYSIFEAEYFFLIKWWKKLIKIRKNFEEKIIFEKKNKFFLNEFDSFMKHINYYLLNFWSWVFLINKMMKKTDKNKKKFWEKNYNFWKKKINFFSINSIVLWIILTIIYLIFEAEYFLLIKWWKTLIKMRKNFEKKL